MSETTLSNSAKNIIQQVEHIWTQNMVAFDITWEQDGNILIANAHTVRSFNVAENSRAAIERYMAAYPDLKVYIVNKRRRPELRIV